MKLRISISITEGYGDAKVYAEQSEELVGISFADEDGRDIAVAVSNVFSAVNDNAFRQIGLLQEAARAEAEASSLR
jgi:hypothetical protein